MIFVWLVIEFGMVFFFCGIGVRFEFFIELGEFKFVVLDDFGMELEFVDVEDEVVGLFNGVEGCNMLVELLLLFCIYEFFIDWRRWFMMGEWL